MTVKYMLDTNICIYIAKEKPRSVYEKFEDMMVGSVCMSIVTYGELLYGAKKSNKAKESVDFVKYMTNLIPPMTMPVSTAEHYGDIRKELASQGKIIGGNDLWIAAHCRSTALTLVTNNQKEFARVADLKLENWV